MSNLFFQREIRSTSDGSKTLYINELMEGFHSSHGALQEANHVFIRNGLELLPNIDLNILEIGFGTGLNAALTLEKASLKNKKIHYFGIEKYPVSQEEIIQLEYFSTAMNTHQSWLKMHELNWDEPHFILPNFQFTKFQTDFFELPKLPIPSIDLVYFDAFGYRVQPTLWEEKLLSMIVNIMKKNGLFVTYSSKGTVRRLLIELGLKMEKVAGPKGKREMMIGWKI